MTNEEKISICFSTICGRVSLIDFKTMLDIILICLSILNLLLILAFKFKNYLKDKKLDAKEIEDISNDFEKLKNLVEEGEEIAGRKQRSKRE